VRAASENAYEVTDAGRQLREAAEVATDRNFYTSWQVLNDGEVTDMQELLARLKTALTQIAEAVPA
jgi:Tfp pilus assembly PilM family ATPase